MVGNLSLDAVKQTIGGESHSTTKLSWRQSPNNDCKSENRCESNLEDGKQRWLGRQRNRYLDADLGGGGLANAKRTRGWDPPLLQGLSFHFLEGRGDFRHHHADFEVKTG